MPPSTQGLSLHGIRIADLTLVLAGTGAASLLADWGAEVIRVEPIQMLQPSTRGPAAHPTQDYIDANRNWLLSYPDWTPGKRPFNRYNFYHAHGRNKMSMTLDLSRPEGVEVFRKLVMVSDVVMENNVPETIDKLGLGYERLRQWRPDLIMLRMPAYGLSGRYRGYRSYGSQLEGAAGHSWIRGYPDWDPSMNEDIYFGDATSTASGAVAVALALRDRRRTGKGRLVEFGQVEALIPCFGENLMDYQLTGRIAGPKGNDLYDFAPHNAYQCLDPSPGVGEGRDRGDRWVAIAVRNDDEWRGLLKAMGEPPWGSDPRFTTQTGRYAHRRELDKLVNEWTLRHEDRWVMETLQGCGVPAGVLNSDRDALADPQLKARGFYEPFDHPDTGRNFYAGVIWKMRRTPNRLRFPPATLGEHNPYVYKELLHLSGEEYARLEREGHIGTEYPPHVA